MSQDGYKPADSISDKIGGLPVTAIIFSDKSEQHTRLEVYAVFGDKALVVFSHPASLERQAFDRTLGTRRFPDFFRDGSRALLYHSRLDALSQSTLYVLRYDRPRFTRVGAFPEARVRDLAGDGRYQIITRARPLGRFFMAECRGFETMAQQAFRTDIQAWRGGKFVSVAAEFPRFYEDAIARDEEALRALEPEKAARPGDYLGLALTLYYDYAQKGDARRGWRRLSALIKAPPHSLPGVSACVEKVKRDLRAELSIPADWP